MLRKKGWLRLALVALVVWWGFCFLRYEQVSGLRKTASENFWAAPAYDSEQFAAQMVAAERAKKSIVIAAFAVPIAVALAVLAAVWVTAGFSANKRSEEE
jgi:ABC-type phosphate transport system permease subunit